MSVRPLRVGILGATGAVGVRFAAMLSMHPWFNVTRLMASERSAGRCYGDVIGNVYPAVPDVRIKEMTVVTCEPVSDLDIVFSGLPGSQAWDIEESFADHGIPVVSNSSAHRMDCDVPLVIPEINPDHLALISVQKKRRQSKGFIVTNPNCSTIALALGLDAVHRMFNITRVVVCTAQAVSGAGYPGLSVMTMLDNAVPYIAEEEPKLESEPGKIFGQLTEAGVRFSDMVVSAGCTRVPVRDGHLMHVSFSVSKKTDAATIKNCWEHYVSKCKDMDLPSSPEYSVKYLDAPDRPQPLLDRDQGSGMTVCAGRLRPCPVMGWKCVILGHNTIRGAAGGAILLAELLVRKNLIE